MAMLLIAAAAALFVAALLAQPVLRRRRRRRLRERPFPSTWRSIHAHRLPVYLRLPEVERRELERRIQVFVAEKDFVGCAGQEVDDEVRILIAAQACLVRLGHPAGDFPALQTILVYPGAFVVERLRPEPSGVVQESRQALSGESWSNGQVVLSWEDVRAGAADPADGRNVVIHEFAHQLDQAKGYANGAPAQLARAKIDRWSRVLGAEFEQLRRELAWGPEALAEPPVLDPYAAADPAEFFAVASEVFFERPHALAARHPALYAELAAFYRIDPRNWF